MPTLVLAWLKVHTFESCSSHFSIVIVFSLVVLISVFVALFIARKTCKTCKACKRSAALEAAFSLLVLVLDRNSVKSGMKRTLNPESLS